MQNEQSTTPFQILNQDIGPNDYSKEDSGYNINKIDLKSVEQQSNS